MDPKKPDPDMIKELDFLLNLETLEEEQDWEAAEESDQEAENE